MRVTVADGGAQTGPRLIDDPAAEHGRGLQLVHGLALRTGVIGNRHGRLVWAEIAWTVPNLAAAELDVFSGIGDASPSEPTQTCSTSSMMGEHGSNVGFYRRDVDDRAHEPATAIVHDPLAGRRQREG